MKNLLVIPLVDITWYAFISSQKKWLKLRFIFKFNDCQVNLSWCLFYYTYLFLFWLFFTELMHKKIDTYKMSILASWSVLYYVLLKCDEQVFHTWYDQFNIVKHCYGAELLGQQLSFSTIIVFDYIIHNDCFYSWARTFLPKILSLDTNSNIHPKIIFEPVQSDQ